MTIKLKGGMCMETIVRPSADLRNHYNEISKECHEKRTPIIITKNGKGDTVVMGLQEYNQMSAELELLRILAEAEDDIINNRVAPMQQTFDDIRRDLLMRG